MALPVWPTSLGDVRPQVNGLSVLPHHKALETEMDDGPPRGRRQSILDSTVLQNFRTRVWTLTQAITFDSFVRDDLNAGVARFSAPVVGTDGTVVTRTCRIVGDRPVRTYRSTTLVEYTFNLLVWGYR